MANDEDGPADGDGGKNNDNNSPRISRSKKMRLLRSNLKDAFFQIDPDDVLYFCISFISIMVVPLSAIGMSASYYELAVNIRPISESILEDLNCSALNLTAEELEDSVCSMDTFETKFSLYHRQVNYFHFTPTFGVSFCEDQDYAYEFLQKLTDKIDELPDDTEELLGGENIGGCTQQTMLATVAFAALTMAFALMGLLWFTVLSDHSGSNKKATKVHVVLSTTTMIFSLITITVFRTAISPLRNAINPTFCDEQTTFLDCEEKVGWAFYCQVSTAILSFLIILIYFVKSRVGPRATTLSCGGEQNEEDLKKAKGDQQQEQKQHPTNSPSRHRFFLEDPHFWIKLGRFLEFFLATVSAMINFTTLELLLPDVDTTPISMSSYLWGDQFCSDRFFATDEFRLTEGGDALTSDLKNFGDCYPVYKYKIIFTLFKIIVSGGSALFLKRDAAKNPFVYLGGLVADVATIVLVCMAITVFMTKIYPGRSGIDPSFCDQYGTLYQSFIDEDEFTDDTVVCNISLGHGFYVLCTVLVLTVGNLLVEFIAGEIGSEYGAWNAYQTVLKRVRRKQYQDAMFGPSSYYRGRANEVGHNPNVDDVIESMKEMDSDSISAKHTDKPS